MPVYYINIFDVLGEDEVNEPSLPPINEIIWGKGFKSLLNTSWADECGV